MAYGRVQFMAPSMHCYICYISSLNITSESQAPYVKQIVCLVSFPRPLKNSGNPKALVWLFEFRSCRKCRTWWRHQMEMFSSLLAIYAGNSQVTGKFPTQRPLTWIFDVFFDMRRNKWLSKQWWGWWFETLWRSLWRHRNETGALDSKQIIVSRI